MIIENKSIAILEGVSIELSLFDLLGGEGVISIIVDDILNIK